MSYFGHRREHRINRLNGLRESRFRVRELRLGPYLDEYTKHEKTIVPSKGFYVYDQNTAYINKDWEKDRFDRGHSILHELGHHLFGRDENKAEEYALNRIAELRKTKKKWGA
jgi:Zn-dependent peptidase ImmA (M78 family)